MGDQWKQDNQSSIRAREQLCMWKERAGRDSRWFVQRAVRGKRAEASDGWPKERSTKGNPVNFRPCLTVMRVTYHFFSVPSRSFNHKQRFKREMQQIWASVRSLSTLNLAFHWPISDKASPNIAPRQQLHRVHCAGRFADSGTHLFQKYFLLVRIMTGNWSDIQCMWKYRFHRENIVRVTVSGSGLNMPQWFPWWSIWLPWLVRSKCIIWLEQVLTSAASFQDFDCGDCAAKLRALIGFKDWTEQSLWPLGSEKPSEIATIVSGRKELCQAKEHIHFINSEGVWGDCVSVFRSRCGRRGPGQVLVQTAGKLVGASARFRVTELRSTFWSWTREKAIRCKPASGREMTWIFLRFKSGYWPVSATKSSNECPTINFSLLQVPVSDGMRGLDCT